MIVFPVPANKEACRVLLKIFVDPPVATNDTIWLLPFTVTVANLEFVLPLEYLIRIVVVVVASLEIPLKVRDPSSGPPR